jgi:hypothetical protein
MPDGFPTDFPVYPAARLTAAASVAANGTTSWTMEWQDLDGVAPVQTFFIVKLDSGDWTLITYSGTIDTSFAAMFVRKSNSHLTGSMKVGIRAGVTTIDLIVATAS